MKYVLVLVATAALVFVGSTQLKAQTNQGYPQQNQNYPQQQWPQTNNGQTNAPVYANNPRGATISAGTQVQIRTNETIDATSQNAGRTYSAEIAQDVIGENGSVLIPRGSPAQLTVGQVNSGTMGVGSNEVALGLQSVSVNGTTYQIASNPVQQQSSNQRGIGANKRTAEMTGGGALLGTVVGAIAGGGKGAAIGAVVGGAGGAATQVLTRGKEVKVPAETLLTFKLDQPLTLQ
jgi:hypothetical protein